MAPQELIMKMKTRTVSIHKMRKERRVKLKINLMKKTAIKKI